MSGRRPMLLSVGLIAVAGLLLSACASKASPGASGSSNSPSAPANGVTVKVATVGILGSALVDGSDRTLYMLTADQGGKVTCNASPCTGVWPPLLVPAGGAPVAGSGLTASKLGTVKTASGATQVTYNSWPLYRYSGDSGSNQANGQGIVSYGGTWHPLAPSGAPIVGGSGASPSSTASVYGY
jgi:predicted lipoprotein with Yx(FWY)xxD motif